MLLKRVASVLLLSAVGIVCAGAGAASSSRPDDLWPQAVDFPDVSRIALKPENDGFTEVDGAAGAVPGGLPVLVVSLNNGSADRVISHDDGSFEAKIAAPSGSWVMVRDDPTASFPGGARWLTAFGGSKADFQADYANAAPASWLRVPDPAPAGPGRPFTFVDEILPGHLDFALRGSQSGDFKPGGFVRISGTAVVYPKGGSAAGLIGRRLKFRARLERRFDAQGRARAPVSEFISSLLTPSGLPIAHPGYQLRDSERWRTETLRKIPGSPLLRADFHLRWPIPPSASSGTYSLWLAPDEDAASAAASLGGARGIRHPYPFEGMQPLPPFRIGTPARPRLLWTLLTDVPSSDGTRGALAAEDEKDVQLMTNIVVQSPRYVVSRLSKKTGEPIAYRLEPYLPMVTVGARQVPFPPSVLFKFPSGSLTVRVTRPDGRVDVLGPAPFKTIHSRAPTTSQGYLLDNGGTNLVDVPQLSSDSKAFDYRFSQSGRYGIRMTGTIEDIYGNVYDGGGTYVVYAARPLNLQPATLPMTPFQVGDSLNPGVTVLPGVPADVELHATLFVESDPERAVRYLVAGRANRFGVFTAGPESARVRMTGPGELQVDLTASYTDKNGELWMGTMRWGQVVETPGAPVIAHGRRGRDDSRAPPEDRAMWFSAPANPGDPSHLQFPYMSGDIVWATRNHAAIPIVTLQDREGAVTKIMSRLNRKGAYYRADYLWDIPFKDRLRMGELPLTLATRSGDAPTLSEPEDIDVHGYWYSGVERPGVRVRENVSDDRGELSGYWFFNELFELQPGVGAEGDGPNNFMFQFGGAVFRDAESRLNRYGIYSSLLVILPDDDPRGSRVFPPFQGANGGPSGGPIMTLGGRPIDAFLVPLAVRPGSILETGDTFSFSAELAPTLPGSVRVDVRGPKGFFRSIRGRANSAGYFYDPAQDFKLTTPGVYHVAAAATFDTADSAGPAVAPYPVGEILGAVDGGFDVYVAPAGGPLLSTDLPPWSVVDGVDPVILDVRAPEGTGKKGTLHYTIGMPGFQLEKGDKAALRGGGRLSYDPLRLSETFPNISTRRGRSGAGRGLANTVWVDALWESRDGRFYPRQFALEGPDLYAP